MPLTNPFTRRRYSPNAVPVPGRAKIPAPDPGPGLSFMVSPAPFYQYVPGDLFEPGTGNWALLPTYETPLNTVWGHGFAINQPITSHIYAKVQTYSQPTVNEFFFRGMPSNQFLLGNSLQIDLNSGAPMPNPIDPTMGTPALSLPNSNTDAGMLFGYTGDDTGSTAPLSGYAG
jgi:hypothetical protein